MRKVITTALVLLLVLTYALATPLNTSAASDDASKYVTLDGEWNFKLYRKYGRMFQYFAYTGVNIVWEDNDAAILPDYETWSKWEKVSVPYDSADTGGLLPITREDGSDFFPSWSEAWFCRKFELPADFTSKETITLLLGIIDDNDVVYINGHLVAASGFIDGNGNPTLKIKETGGFDYTNADSSAQVKFEKSYWEVQREYTIPANVLNFEGENEIAIRIYNNNSFGGFYSGRPIAICGNDLAVRKVKGLPSTPVSSALFEAVVAKQKEAIESGNIELFAETVYDGYNNNGMDKEGRVAEIQEYFDKYTSINVTDTNAGYYIDDEGGYWYSAKRTITGTNKETGTEETIMDGDIEVCYILVGDAMYERGNWSRCYSVSYYSGLFDRELTYSIYLPIGYWENTSKEYPVVYLLHGINSSSSSFVNVDRIQDHMDQWISDDLIVEMIVVMPDSGKQSFYRDTAYNPQNHDGTGPWQTHITSEIREEIESKYRALKDRKFRGITGISMGGYGAMKIGTSFPDLYSSVASHMGALSEDSLNSLKSLSEELLKEYSFYLDCGLQDGMVDYQGTVKTHEYLLSKGIEHVYSLRNGGHNSAFYMEGMPYSMKMHSDHFIANGLENYGEGQFIVREPVFKDAAGNTLTKLVPSADLRASVSITNNGEAERDACLIVALYSADNSVKNISYIEGKVGAGQTYNFNAGFKLPADVTGHYVKVFVWDSISGMRPLSNAVTFE
ncbi:MAG TPA: hypothetical protein GXX36_00290 [Clostridiaceae bacterium]|nr:hypothetical protein [Clostridiaceae bacterium]